MRKCNFMFQDWNCKSSEHAYCAKKCEFAEEDDLLKSVLNAPDAFTAKQLASSINPTKLNGWDICKVDIMKEILFAKAKGVPEFYNALLKSGDKLIVEITDDEFWGNGMTNVLLGSSTHPDYYRGKNKLGVCLQFVRSTMQANNKCTTITESMTEEETDSSSSGSETDDSEILVVNINDTNVDDQSDDHQVLKASESTITESSHEQCTPTAMLHPDNDHDRMRNSMKKWLHPTTNNEQHKPQPKCESTKRKKNFSTDTEPSFNDGAQDDSRVDQLSKENKQRSAQKKERKRKKKSKS